jgi:hypothetical protein
MRTILFSLLLASVATTPALAERQRDRNADQARTEQADRTEPARSESPRSESPRFERSERASIREMRSEPREQRQVQVQEPEQRAPRTMSSDPGWQRRGGDDNALHSGRDPRPMFERGGADENIDQVQQRFERRERAIREGRGQDPNQQWSERWGGRRDGPRVSSVPRPDAQPALRTDGRRQPVQWNRDWRGDHRYDWQGERRRHRSRFHIGFYYDPFGWNYRPFQVGWRMWPDYYSSRYWINDPWQYRLPYAPPGTRWIRYWDDALLVDTWTGEVIDRIPNFFW